MKVSKYIKAHKDILIEYIYDDGNNISESYKILMNSRDNTNSFVSGDLSSTKNTEDNQLFVLDRITRFFGKVNPKDYSFLQFKDYPSGFPIRFDKIRIHLPVNYTFGEYLGCYIRAYSYDKNNSVEYTLSNFYFDNSDVNDLGLLSYSSPPLRFQDKLWGKSIDIEIPSIYSVSRQMSGTSPKKNSLNGNLTNGFGFSQTAPIFIDFSFISTKKTVNGLVGYYVNDPYKISFPQTPEFENLGVKIEHSTNGDFFEIYGIFNGNIAEFKTFIENARLGGRRYYVEYNITLFEQNIRGKTIKITVTDNFNEKVEYRPIIKFSTTTAVVDVEMRMIDSVDSSMIYRRASYGMLQDEVAKYSSSMTKINLTNANKPKIYSLKNFTGLNLSGLGGGGVGGLIPGSNITTVVQPVNVDRTVLVDKFNLIAKSDNVSIGSNVFYGIGKLKIILQPFDNLVKFTIAKDVSVEQVPGTNPQGNLAYNVTPEYLDMTNMGEISFVIKNTILKFETGLYVESNSINLSLGQVVFRIPESSMRDIKSIFESGATVFYITSRLNSVSTVVYSGLYDIFDSLANIELIKLLQKEAENEVLSVAVSNPLIDGYSQNQAIVYRIRNSTSTSTPSATQSNGVSNSSNQSSVTINGVNYAITTNSSLVIDGYEWTVTQIRSLLGLDANPISLTIITSSLYSSGQFLDNLVSLSNKLQTKFLTTPELRTQYEQTVSNFKNNAG